MTNKNKTVVRTMTILDLFEEHAELSFQEIIELSGIPKTSVYRMLKSLEEMSFLEKGEDAKYRLGLIFLKYGHLVSNRIDIRQVAYPLMETLHNDVKEAVNLIIRQEDEAVYIEKLDTQQKVRLYTAVGRRSPLYAGACSRVILSFLPNEEIDQYLASVELKSFAKGTILDKEMLREKIQQTRANGYTVSYSELENYTSAIAAPIFDYKGEIIAGISIAGFEANYEEEQLILLVDKIKKTALEISKRLGYLVPES